MAPAPVRAPVAGPPETPATLSSRSLDCSSGLDEAVEHLLRAGFLEFDVELVAVDRDHAAIAELLVEHALTDGEVGLVAFDGAAVVEGLVAPAGAGAAYPSDT